MKKDHVCYVGAFGEDYRLENPPLCADNGELYMDSRCGKSCHYWRKRPNICSEDYGYIFSDLWRCENM